MKILSASELLSHPLSRDKIIWWMGPVPNGQQSLMGGERFELFNRPSVTDCLTLDGVNQYAVYNDPKQITKLTQNYSVSFSLYLEGAKYYAGIISRLNSTADWMFRITFRTMYFYPFWCADETIPFRRWVRVVASVKNGYATIYQNGVVIGQGEATSYTGVNELLIGIDGSDLSRTLNGRLKDIGIWKRTLSRDEVITDYLLSSSNYQEIANKDVFYAISQNTLTKNHTLNYAIRQSVATTISANYAVHGDVVQISLQNWDVFKTISLVQELTWVTQANNQANYSVEWTVKALADKQIVLNWNIYNPIPSQFSLQWHTRGFAQSTYEARWKVIKAIASNHSLNWYVRQSVNLAMGLLWSVEFKILALQSARFESRICRALNVETTIIKIWKDNQMLQLADSGVKFILTIKNENGVVIDLSDSNTKKIVFSRPNGTIVEQVASFVTDGTDGQIYWSSLPDELNQIGTWRIQGIIAFESSVFHSQISTFKVLSNILP